MPADPTQDQNTTTFQRVKWKRNEGATSKRTFIQLNKKQRNKSIKLSFPGVLSEPMDEEFTVTPRSAEYQTQRRHPNMIPLQVIVWPQFRIT